MVTCGWPWKPRVKPLVADGDTVQVLYRTAKVSLSPYPNVIMISLTVLLFIGDDILVVLGGRNAGGETLSDCHQLHLPSLTWSEVRPVLHVHRAH